MKTRTLKMGIGAEIGGEKRLDIIATGRMTYQGSCTMAPLQGNENKRVIEN